MKQITLKVFHLWQGYSRALLRWMYAGTYRMRTTENLDTVPTFDLDRFRSGWLPAIDMLRSRSNLLTDHRVGAIHRETTADMHRLFTRYADLHHHVEWNGPDNLFWLDDREEDEKNAQRARRLHRFLTQSLPNLEIYIRKVGRYIDLEDTIAGCRAILARKYDDTPEEAFDYQGTIEDVIEAAKTGKNKVLVRTWGKEHQV